VRRVRHRGCLHLPLGDRLPRPDARRRLAVREHVRVRRRAPPRPGLRLAEGGPELALKKDTAPPVGSDAPGNDPSALTVRQTDVTAPIVVTNTLWQSTDPNAYQGTLEPEVTHLREVEASGIGRRDDARWSGVLEVIPTKADYLLDLIRANSLWPLLSGLACCAMEMMSSATSRNDMDRWGMFPFRASPRQADVLIVAGTLTTKMAGPLVRLWEQMPEPKWCVAMGD